MTSVKRARRTQRAEFECSPGRVQSGYWMMAAGAGLVVLAIGGFVLVLFRDVDQMTMHSMSTFPMILAVGLLTGGWSLTRGPRRVVISQDGLELEGRKGVTEYSWDEIGWTANGVTMFHQKYVAIYDRSGKELTSLSEAFREFDRLSELVKARVAERAGDDAQQIKLKKARRSAMLMYGFGTFLLIGCVFIAWTGWDTQRSAALLESEGIEGEAKIDELVVAPNGYTKRVYYTVTSDSGESGFRNAEVRSDYYDKLEESSATTVPVVFVPSEPTISRLVEGEVAESDMMDNPLANYGLAGVCSLMVMFFYGAAALHWRGWDLDLDSKSGKLSIKQFGEGE